MERRELDSQVIETAPCPKCGSPDNVKVYADGHRKCWSGGCDYWRPPTDADSEEHQAPHEPPEADPTHQEGELPMAVNAFDDMTKRRILGKTLRKFGIYRADYKGQEALVHPIYDQRGRLAYQKLRLPGKKFVLLPMMESPPKVHQCKMEGQQVYGERFNKSVTICVGEFDMLSVYQTLGDKAAVVSVVGGDDTALKNMQANWLWLDSFETIRLWFDDDDSGQRVVEDCAKLFKIGKVKLIRAQGYKDANECLQDDKPGAITEAYWGAVTWRPRGLVNASVLLDDVLADDIGVRGYDFPWPQLNDATVGLLAGHVCYLVAGTGVGKTTGAFEMEYKLWQQGATVGIMGFEDMRRDILLGLLTVHLSVRVSLVKQTKEVLTKAHKEVFDDGRFVLFDPETAEWTMAAILGYVRYMAKALGCTVIVIDPLSFLAALAMEPDERKALDHSAAQLALLAKELGLCIIIAHHLKRVEGKSHEEGGRTSLSQLRGSGGLAMFASYVIGLERDQQGEDEDGDAASSTATGDTTVRLLKNRPASKTGRMDILRYNDKTGRLVALGSEGDRASHSASRVLAQRQAARPTKSSDEELFDALQEACESEF